MKRGMRRAFKRDIQRRKRQHSRKASNAMTDKTIIDINLTGLRPCRAAVKKDWGGLGSCGKTATHLRLIVREGRVEQLFTCDTHDPARIVDTIPAPSLVGRIKCPSCLEYEGIWIHHGHVPEDTDCPDENDCHVYCQNCDWGICPKCDVGPEGL